MLELKADLWSFTDDYKIVTTNGILNKQRKLVMGKGVAKVAADTFPILPTVLGVWVEQYGNRPFRVERCKIITWPTKTDWKLPSKLDFVIDNGHKVLEIVNKFNIPKVYSPLPGCGNGGLNWSTVKTELEKFLDDRFIFCNL